MSDAASKFREAFSSTGILVLITYSLYRSVAYSSYVTNFGWSIETLAYVSNIPFMMGASAGTLLSSLVIFALYRQCRLKPLTLNYRIPLAFLALTYCSVTFAPQLMTLTGALVFLGLIWGLAATIVSVAVIELLTYATSPVVLIVQLACSSLLSAGVSLIVSALPQTVGNIFCIIITLSVFPLIAACRNRVVPYTVAPVKRAWKHTLKNSSTPIMACAFFELITGLVNMFAFYSAASFTISSQAPVQGMTICAVLLIVFVVITNRTPNQRIVYLVVFPGLIAIFLLLPFFSDILSRPISTVIYTAYIFTSTLSTFCYIIACRESYDSPYGITAFAAAIIRVCLVIGLVLGWQLGNLDDGQTFMHVLIVCVVCVYVLGMVVVLWGFKSAREKPSVEVVVEHLAVPLTFEETVAQQADALVKEFGLTARERDVLLGLAHGNTAASIATDLCLSTSTVQSYIKTLYAKLGVNRKQQVIDLFTEKAPK